jgi:hypothetical protein
MASPDNDPATWERLMKRVIYAVVTASAIGLAAGGVALAYEQHMTQNDQGAAAAKGKLAMMSTPIAAPDRIVRDDDENKGGDKEKSDDGK